MGALWSQNEGRTVINWGIKQLIMFNSLQSLSIGDRKSDQKRMKYPNNIMKTHYKVIRALLMSAHTHVLLLHSITLFTLPLPPMYYPTPPHTLLKEKFCQITQAIIPPPT